MSYTAVAAVARSQEGALSLEEVSISEPQAGELLVRVEACGICHTDTKYRRILPLPAVFGHEGVGTVEAVGADVTSVRPGDRVIMAYPFCGACPACRNNRTYGCESIPKLKFSGGRYDGSKPISVGGESITSAFFQQSAFATRALTRETSVVPVSTDLPVSLLAALPCGVQTGAGAVFNTFALGSSHSIFVVGAGTVGLSAIMAAKVAGVYPRIISDLVPERLELAREVGASHVLDARTGDVVQQVRKIAPHGVTHALETAVSMAALEQAIECLAQGGKVGIVSAPPAGVKFPFSTRGIFERVASLWGIIQGSAVSAEFIPRLVKLVESGALPVDKIVSAYDFEDINRALVDVKSGRAVKAVLVMSR